MIWSRLSRDFFFAEWFNLRSNKFPTGKESCFYFTDAISKLFLLNEFFSNPLIENVLSFFFDKR